MSALRLLLTSRSRGTRKKKGMANRPGEGRGVMGQLEKMYYLDKKVSCATDRRVCEPARACIGLLKPDTGSHRRLRLSVAPGFICMGGFFNRSVLRTLPMDNTQTMRGMVILNNSVILNMLLISPPRLRVCLRTVGSSVAEAGNLEQYCYGSWSGALIKVL